MASLPKSRREFKNPQNRDLGVERRSPEPRGRIPDTRLNLSSSTSITEDREYSRKIRETYSQKESEREEKKKKTNEKEKKNSFHNSYDQREGEIRKENWGIALKNVSTENIYKTDTLTQRASRNEEDPIAGVTAQNKGELTGPLSDREQTTELFIKIAKLVQKDNNLRRLLYEMLEEPDRQELEIRRLVDREEEEIRKKIERRKREEEMEEERIRQRQIVNRIKKRHNGGMPTVYSTSQKWRN